MSFRLVPKSVTLNDLERRNGRTFRYFTEFGKSALQKTICGGIYPRVIVFLVRVQCRRKESSRSLSHLLMSFLLYMVRCRKWFYESTSMSSIKVNIFDLDL